MNDPTDAAAETIAAHRRRRDRLAPLPESGRPTDEESAYRIQRSVHRLLARERGAVVGQKIGCTTEVMQRYLGIDHPCAGGVFEKSVQRRHGVFRTTDFCRVGVECELVVQLKHDLSRPDSSYRRADVAKAVECWMAGIEIVDDRYVDFRTLGVWTLVADDFFQAACVIGDAARIDVEPADLTGGMTINGREVGNGTGRDILGDPLAALAWLANARAFQGEPLLAGSFVFLGSLVQTNWVGPGDRVIVSIERLGSASAEFH